MILPTRGHYLAEVLPREQLLPSGLWVTGKPRLENKDNVCRCLGVGDPKYLKKGKYEEIVARRTDILHFSYVYKKFRCEYQGKKLIFLSNDDIIAIERDGKFLAPGSRVIVKLVRQEKVGSIYLSDGAQVLEGEFYGKVIAVGAEYPDKSLNAGDELIFLRNEGHRFTGYLDRVEYLSVREQWIYGIGFFRTIREYP